MEVDKTANVRTVEYGENTRVCWMLRMQDGRSIDINEVAISSCCPSCLPQAAE
jgi:hypothetical protein